MGTTGLHTTVEDLARWDRNFYEMKVGGAEGIALMHAPGRLNSGRETAYAFGLELGRYRGLRTVGHSGHDAGYASMLLRFPDRRLSVALLCNTAPADPWFRAYSVADLYLPDPLPGEARGRDRMRARESRPAGEDLEAYAGIYRSGNGLTVQRFAVEDGTLIATVEGARFPLRQIGERRFDDGLTHYVLTFGEVGNGEERIATWSPNPTAGSSEPLRLYRIGPHWEPAPQDLPSYAGTFHSEALDASWEMVAGDGELVLRRWGVADQPLEPLLPETFVFRGSTAPRLRFERDAAGRVGVISLSTDQIMGLEFVRRGEP